MSYYFHKPKFEEAVQNVREGKWIGKFESVNGSVEINWHGDLPILSAGCSQNLYYDVDENQIPILVEMGCTVRDWESGKKFVVINTGKDMYWVSICNFRRYGWCSSPAQNSDSSYSGTIFANGDRTFPSELDRDIYLRVELARLIGQVSKQYDHLSTVLSSKTFKLACEMILKDATEHHQRIGSYNGGIVNEDERITYKEYSKELSGKNSSVSI